jgi:hypothetical protein
VAYEEACTFEVSAQLRKFTALCSTIREKNDTRCWSTFNMVEMVFRFQSKLNAVPDLILLISSLFELGQKFGGSRKWMVGKFDNTDKMTRQFHSQLRKTFPLKVVFSTAVNGMYKVRERSGNTRQGRTRRTLTSARTGLFKHREEMTIRTRTSAWTTNQQ